jgi:hypothetical protein
VKQTLLVSIVLGCSSLIGACGAGDSTAGSGGSSAFVSFPGYTEVGLGVGANHTFAATVTGTANTAVVYSVQEGAAGGSITAAGVYTAPLTAGTYHVIATSVADGTRSATVPVTAVPSVSITPGSARIIAGGSQTFRTTVLGTSDAGVIFSATTGSITAAGVYTAPQTPGIYSVVAASLAAGRWVNTASNLGAATATVTVATSDMFAPTGSMAIDRTQHTATLLLDGTILVAGGLKFDTAIGGGATAAAELYDATSGTFAATGSMATHRYGHNATLLANGALANAASYGKVLVTGGGSQTAELYDPATRLFTTTGSYQFGRNGETATLLDTGDVLVAGGGTATAELYDPATGFFAATGSMAAARTGHTATLLQDGRVLVAGGGSATAELYDPATGFFAATGSMANVRSFATATLLQDGTVLVAGGYEIGRQGERFDPSTGSFAPVGVPNERAVLFTANLLGNGTVVFAGGLRGRAGLPSVYAELFFPKSDGFIATGSLHTARDGHSATLLIDGRVLVAGGEFCSPPLQRPGGISHCWSLSSAELYQ